ncbi:MAG: hypothetical protein ACREL5_13955, partial [Gemmatimonadales bacterium]
MSVAPSHPEIAAPSWVHHDALLDWVRTVARLTTPDRVHWCDGSQHEYDALCDEMVASG